MDGTTESESKVKTGVKKKCVSAMANIISEVNYKHRSQDCVFNETTALCEIEYDGSKESLEAGLRTTTTQHKLREYGMQRTVSFITNAIPDLYDREGLAHIQEVLVLHDNNLLIRIVNTAEDPDSGVMHLDVGQILKAVNEQDFKLHTTLVQEKLQAEFTDWAVGKAEYLQQNLKKPIVVAGVVGAVLAVVSYLTFWK
jgi:hypothetical protein